MADSQAELIKIGFIDGGGRAESVQNDCTSGPWEHQNGHQGG